MRNGLTTIDELFYTMIRRKILFVLPSFEIGGTTVSTRNLISVLDKDKYDIAVWTLHDEGALRWMYNDIMLYPSCFTARVLMLKGWRYAKSWPTRILAAVVRYFAHRPQLQQYMFRHAIKKCLGQRQFDTVVACQEGIASRFAKAVPSGNHVAWIRCDYKRYFEEILKSRPESIYQNYNHIVCVSEIARKNFAIVYPNLDSRTVCIYNPQDSEMILKQAEINDNDIRFHSNETNVIVSLGRLSGVKRFKEIPFIAKCLLNKGLGFHWYIIGDGEEWRDIAENIKRHGVSNHVIMLGAKSNPHYYIKHASLYVCLSSSEACPRVINEAKILGTPVVSTDFPTVYEYLENGVNGRIATMDDIPNVISEMLTDKQLYSRIKNEITGFTFDNSSLIAKLEKIL